MRKPSFSNFPLSKLSFIDRLPRQARDKHTESSKHDFPSHTAAVAPSVGTLVLSHNQVGKRVCLRQCMLEVIILPRHARDKHTESTQKILRLGGALPQPAAARQRAGAGRRLGQAHQCSRLEPGVRNMHFLSHFLWSKRSIYQDRLGTNISRTRKSWGK